MKIRKFAQSDQASLVELWRKVFPDDPSHNEPGKVIADKLHVDDLVFVAESNGKLIAACMAGYDGHRGWLYGVAVDPESRRVGIGTEIVKHALSELKKLGCGKVNLQIRAGNFQVQDFYKSLGFNTEERISMGIFLV